MTPWWFTLFAVCCAAQRLGEIRHCDRRFGSRRPHWTATALLAVHGAVLIAAVTEAWIRQPAFSPLLLSLGGLLFSLGFLLRRWVIRTMRDQWSIDVERLADHRLITSGPFAWCRHPNYLAILLEVGGIGLIGQAFLTLAFGFPSYALLLLARIVAEERVLLDTFGGAYRQYRRGHSALLPLGRLPARWARR